MRMKINDRAAPEKSGREAALTFAQRFFAAFAYPNRSRCSVIIRGGRCLSETWFV